MKTPRKEQLYSYIKTKTERLQDTRNGIGRFSFLLVVILPWAIPLEISEPGTVAALLAIGLAGVSSLRAIASMHIDLLVILKRDIDRDEEEGLVGFETAD